MYQVKINHVNAISLSYPLKNVGPYSVPDTAGYDDMHVCFTIQ